jgi:hypothetical protein
MKPKGVTPPPVPPKDYQMRPKPATMTCTTAKSSPTLVSGQSPRTSPRKETTDPTPKIQIQRSKSGKSVRDALGRVGARLSPLPSMEQMRDSIPPSEKGPGSGDAHMIHVKMDFGLNKFVSSVVRPRPPSLPIESPLDPTWPLRGSLKRDQSNRSNGALSNNTRSSRSSMPTVHEMTPTKHDSMPTPKAM